MESIVARDRRHADAFEERVAAVADDAWANPSPCAAWDARDVVRHVVEMHDVMLRPLGPSSRDGPTVDDDPLAAFRAARAQVEAVLDDVDLAAVESKTPTGSMTVAQHIDAVVSDDLVLHGWDLARATGQDETIDPGDVRRLWEAASAIPDEVMRTYRDPALLHGIEVYGPEVVVPPDAALQDRLLGLVGRAPT